MKSWEPEPVVPAPAAPEVGRRRRFGAGAAAAVFAAGLIAGVILAGLNIAGAQTPTPTPSTPSVPNVQMRMFAHHGPGFGTGGIHGEFTTRAPGGGYQTLASQVGEVTSVSASSITVRSEDGYARTYSIDDNTLVTAGNNGIADVTKGDDVHVTAVVSGGKARAVDIMDVTQTGTLRGRWLPPARLPGSSG